MRRFDVWSLSLLSALIVGCGLGGDDPRVGAADCDCPASPEVDEGSLNALCAERVSDSESRAVQAQERVVTLQRELAGREAELAELEAAAINDATRRAAQERKRRALEEDIARLRSTIGTAEQDRDAARAQLAATLKRLDAQIEETERYKQEAQTQREVAVSSQWSAFVADAKVQVCDRGSKRRHERCHDAVNSALDVGLQRRFESCVSSGQAVPVLRQLAGEEAPPQFAQALPDDNKFTRKGWVVVFCDPTLPEKVDAAGE